MRVLEPPIIWILVAVVLVALAAALIVFASLRRSRARRRAAAWGPAAALEPARPPGDRPRHSAEPDPETVPLDISSARVPTVPPPGYDAPTDPDDHDDAGQHGDDSSSDDSSSDDPGTDDAPDVHPEPVRPAGALVPPTSLAPSFTTERSRSSHDPSREEEPIAAPLFRPWTMQARADTRGQGAHPRHALDDAAPAAEPADTDAEIPVADEGVLPQNAEDDDTADTADPAPHGTETAKDRLLAVLLRDPQAALRALDGDATGGEAGLSATALLRAGLTPAQVATLVGVEEGELASVVARGLGLLRHGQEAPDRSPTEEPDRSWAGAATPTTG